MILDDEHDNTYYNALSNDPDIIERHDDCDPRIDNHGFLRSQQDFEVLFQAQDTFIAKQSKRGSVDVQPELFYNAHATAVHFIDPYGCELPHAHNEPES